MIGAVIEEPPTGGVARYVEDRAAPKRQTQGAKLTRPARHGANVFHQHEKVPAVGRRRHKAKMPIEPRRRIIFCMNGKRANPDNIDNLQGASQGIQEQASPDAAPLPVAVHGKPRQHEKRYGITRHAFDNANGCVNMTNLTRYNRVEPNNRLVA